jgi:hypothetical protein
MREVTKMSAARSSPHRQGIDRSLDGAPRVRVNHFLRIHLRPAFPPISRAPRGLRVGEGPLAAASPQTIGSGGTDSALRLVTRWSSDALRLSSSGRTGRKSPLKAAARYAYPRRPRKTLQTLGKLNQRHTTSPFCLRSLINKGSTARGQHSLLLGYLTIVLGVNAYRRPAKPDQSFNAYLSRRKCTSWWCQKFAFDPAAARVLAVRRFPMSPITAFPGESGEHS